MNAEAVLRVPDAVARSFDIMSGRIQGLGSRVLGVCDFLLRERGFLAGPMQNVELPVAAPAREAVPAIEEK